MLRVKFVPNNRIIIIYNRKLLPHTLLTVLLYLIPSIRYNVDLRDRSGDHSGFPARHLCQRSRKLRARTSVHFCKLWCLLLRDPRLGNIHSWDQVDHHRLLDHILSMYHGQPRYFLCRLRVSEPSVALNRVLSLFGHGMYVITGTGIVSTYLNDSYLHISTTYRYVYTLFTGTVSYLII